MFISFEGIDCCGKTTQVKLLIDKLQSQKKEAVLLREPGGTIISERIREILLDKKNSHLTQIAEVLLFSASRTQLVSEIIMPALSENKIVICDRYVDSTTVYQGYGRGISLDAIQSLNATATIGVMPQKTFFIDITIEEMFLRRKNGRQETDRMEMATTEFYNRVRNGYIELSRKEPNRFVVIDGKQPIEAIHTLIWNEIEKLFTSVN